MLTEIKLDNPKMALRRLADTSEWELHFDSVYIRDLDEYENEFVNCAIKAMDDFCRDSQ